MSIVSVLPGTAIGAATIKSLKCTHDGRGDNGRFAEVTLMRNQAGLYDGHQLVLSNDPADASAGVSQILQNAHCVFAGEDARLVRCTVASGSAAPSFSTHHVTDMSVDQHGSLNIVYSMRVGGLAMPQDACRFALAD